jgi:hypothetical protein
MRVQGAQAGKAGVYNPELAAPGFATGAFRADPGGFVGMNIIGKMGGASEKAGVRGAGEFGGDIRGVPQEPDFPAGADGDGPGFYGNAHGAFELVESQGEPVFPGGYHHKVPGLIGGDQDGQTQLREEPGETIRVGATDVAVFL